MTTVGTADTDVSLVRFVAFDEATHSRYVELLGRRRVGDGVAGRTLSVSRSVTSSA